MLSAMSQAPDPQPSADDHRVTDIVMPEAALFVSFWDVGLENIPEGTFAHRLLSPATARAMIEAARAAGRLCGASDDDLFAPEQERELRQHEELRRVLAEHHDIALKVDDFLMLDDGDEGFEPPLRPLALVDFDAQNRLLVIDCQYELARGQPPSALQFNIDPESVTFHLFEAV
jgi:hypothetical protein